MHQLAPIAAVLLLFRAGPAQCASTISTRGVVSVTDGDTFTGLDSLNR